MLKSRSRSSGCTENYFNVKLAAYHKKIIKYSYFTIKYSNSFFSTIQFDSNVKKNTAVLHNMITASKVSRVTTYAIINKVRFRVGLMSKFTCSVGTATREHFLRRSHCYNVSGYNVIRFWKKKDNMSHLLCKVIPSSVSQIYLGTGSF